MSALAAFLYALALATGQPPQSGPPTGYNVPPSGTPGKPPTYTGFPSPGPTQPPMKAPGPPTGGPTTGGGPLYPPTPKGGSK